MGKNAQRRKDQRLIEKYGQLPPEPTRVPWGRVFASLLMLVLIVVSARDLYAKAKPKVTSMYYGIAGKPKKQATPTPSLSAVATSQPATPSVQSTPNQSSEQEKKQMFATMSTTMGDIKFELYSDAAPKTVENFVQLAKKGYYDNVIFHRIIKNFMIQGGDPTGTGRGGESAFGSRFDDEINAKSLGLSDSQIRTNEASGYKYRTDLQSRKNEPGALSMANAGPNTNGSQFFIITESHQAHLDGKHTVFGKVVEGMDTVKKMAAVEVDSSDRPKTDVKITGIKIEEK